MAMGVRLGLIVLVSLALAGAATAAPMTCVVPAAEGDPAYAQGVMALTESALRDLPESCVAPRRQTCWVLSDLSVAQDQAPRPDEAIEAATRIGAEVVIFAGLRRDGADWVATSTHLTRRDPQLQPPIEARSTSAQGALRDALTQVMSRLSEAQLSPGDAVHFVWPPTSSDDALLAFFEGCGLDSRPEEAPAAERAFRRAIDLDPAFTLAHKEYSGLLRELGRKSEAAEELRLALERRPDMAILLSNLGAALADLEEFDEAEDALSQAINLGTDLLAAAYAHNNLGLVYRRQKLLDRAMTEFERARRMLPRYSMAHANVAWIHMELEQYDQAQEVLRRVVEFRNDRAALAYAHRLLGDIALRQERYDEAVAAYQAALQVRPDYAMVYVQIGYTEKRRGNVSAAKEAYTAAIGLNTDPTATAYAHNSLGNIYRDEGGTGKAAAEYEAALRIMPDYELARKNLEKLTGGR